MTKKISETKPVTEFINIATEFCLLLEEREKKDGVRLLQEAFIILPQLCLGAMLLPEIKRFSDYDVPILPYEKRKELFDSLQSKFKGSDVYRFVYDPFDADDESITSSVSDDLADIYIDIKPGLNEWDTVSSTDRLMIIWEWWFLFGAHWGHHANRVLPVLYSLLYEHLEDQNGDYVGMRNVSSDNVKFS